MTAVRVVLPLRPFAHHYRCRSGRSRFQSARQRLAGTGRKNV